MQAMLIRSKRVGVRIQMFVLYRYIGWILVIIMEINAILHIFFLYNILMPERTYHCIMEVPSIVIFQPRSQGLSSLPPLSLRKDPG